MVLQGKKTISEKYKQVNIPSMWCKVLKTSQLTINVKPTVLISIPKNNMEGFERFELRSGGVM